MGAVVHGARALAARRSGSTSLVSNIDRLHDPRAVHARHALGHRPRRAARGIVRERALLHRACRIVGVAARVRGRVVRRRRAASRWHPRDPRWIAAVAAVDQPRDLDRAARRSSSGASASARGRSGARARARARRAHRARGGARQPARAAGADRAALPLQHARQRDEPHRPGSGDGEAHARELHPLPARLARRHAHAKPPRSAPRRELIAAYLDVLQVRMGARLRYSRRRRRPSSPSFALPPMLLQPVVENAIRHGLEPKVEGGEVAMRARARGRAAW